ncbi:hypothetical protein [Mucilaginibacter paludis]|uniref:Uncharacterized protein n=1 Tax=Mucilaginibacter paludis DSM 18603 TaxID=714943 RepID=H1YIK6_9SPHI|nr:hypothetical protein [Mucilaginibacter paludis]EHQ26572.1 hypothetical protein Mucpa_2450 [Mucilaginibacter paludis DSM 18603]
MATLQKKWLRAVSFIALFFAIVGFGYVVKAEVSKIAHIKTAKVTPVKKHKQVDYYWYQKNASGNYVFDHTGSEPTSGCPSVGDEYCAKGFTSSQSGTITDATTAQANRYYSE